MSPGHPDGPFRRAVAGAATGGAWMALLALLEIVRAPGPLREPWADLSRLALGGALVGLVLGAAATRLGRLSPGGIVLGTALAAPSALDALSAAGTEPAGAALRAGVWLLGGAVAGQVAGMLARRGRSRPMPGLVTSLAILILLSIPLLVPRGPGGRAPSRPNFLLLTIDTLRSDRLGLAGHSPPTSPHLDRLARRGLTREGVVTPLPRTLPAVCSLLTGREPHSHGVRDNFHYALGGNARTIAEILAGRGWATAAVNSNPVLSHDSGVYQGFESASDRGDDRAHLRVARGVRRLLTLAAMRRGDRADVITDLALDWLANRPDRPFFLWVHWLAPHMPYEPAPPFDRRFDPDYRGRFERRIDYGPITKGEMTYRNPLTPAERKHAKALYDGEVATADRALGRLLREMELRGDLENTVILATSDHGESLDEHGYFFNHGDFVYGPAANVPMVVVLPPDQGVRFGGVDRTAMSLIDVAPWLLQLADLSPEDEEDAPMDGRVPGPEPRALFGESGFCRFPHLNDRLGWVLPRDIAQSPDLVPDWTTDWEEQANRAKQRFVQTSRWKLVLSPHPEGDRVELFDLQRDPGERVDRSGVGGGPEDELLAGLAAWMELGLAAPGTADERHITDEQRARLEGLGYLGN